MQHLVIGLGEIGKSLQNVLECHGIDKDQKSLQGQYDFLHICIPFGENFVETVKEYRQKFSPKIVFIHSTVEVGTTEKIPQAVHTPIRGIHPHLEEGIKSFVKFVGGDEMELTGQAVEELKKFGIKAKAVKGSRNTEAGKLWSTTQYGYMIMLQKHIYKYCLEHNLDFDMVYTQFNDTYNEAYARLGHSEFVRPVLRQMDGKIGGHCIIPNCRILNDKVSQRILQDNEQL